MQKPGIPKGTRDFNPSEVHKRRYILNTIEKVFQKYGFMPIETPSMENLSTLEGKYGEEGDKLLFRILESGDYFKEPRNELVRTTYHVMQFLRALFYYQISSSGVVSAEKLDLIGEISIEEIEDYIIKNHIVLYKARLIEAISDDCDKVLESISRLARNLAIMIQPLLRQIRDNIHLKNSIDYEFIFDRHFLLTDGVAKLADLIALEFGSKDVTKAISAKGLRYDLTVPFARYVVMNRNDITFPFKRYQMQPVWRADRPQRGRYREFWQCDADVVGSDSLLNEVDLVLIYAEVFAALGIGVTIQYNNRKLLQGLSEILGLANQLVDMTIILDKKDKVGMPAVVEELTQLGADREKLNQFVACVEPFDATRMTAFFSNNEIAAKGLEELNVMRAGIAATGFEATGIRITHNLALARGLSYYTGAIFEVVVDDKRSTFTSSIGGGGRYDNLTGIFGLPNVSGVGISFGLDRIYDVVEEMKIFPEDLKGTSTRVLICAMDADSRDYALRPLRQLREAGIATELYPDLKKIGKQLDYANALQIPYAIIIGETERLSGSLMLKSLNSGTQESCSIENIIEKLK